jgi:Domain of unknown function (DUF6487)
MKCPECGKEMENGVVSSSGYLVWSEKPIRILLAGEEIPMDWGFFNPRHMQGSRCKACKLIVSQYKEIDKPDGYPVNMTGSTYEDP